MRGAFGLTSLEMAFTEALALIALARLFVPLAKRLNLGTALTKDPTHGHSRILLLTALEKSRSAVAQEALLELRRDPVFEREFARLDSSM